MRRPRRRPTYYTAHCLQDGTVLAAYPMRKPSPHVLKRDGLWIDADNICNEFDTSGSDLRDVNNDGRTRFQDIVANRLNVNRAIREIVLLRLDAVESQLTDIKTQLDRIEQAVKSFSDGDHTIKEC